jgi:TetR/AcrR family transcriptional regulator
MDGEATAEPRSAGRSRIQERNRALILEAGLAVFSSMGFSGATLDRIAKAARLSKPNLLYYFPSKEAIHLALLENLLDAWLAPLRALDPEGEPVEEVLAYVRRKLELARDFPRESRLFANEVLRGRAAPGEVLGGELAALVEDKSASCGAGWTKGARPRAARAPVFSIWALTQHYADFDAQVRAVLGEGRDPFAEAGPFLETLFRRSSRPDAREPRAGRRIAEACAARYERGRTAGPQMAMSDSDDPNGGAPAPASTGRGRRRRVAPRRRAVPSLPTPGQHHTGSLWKLTLGSVGRRLRRHRHLAHLRDARVPPRHRERRAGRSSGEVIGVISLLIWSLIVVVTFKYFTFVLRADNRGRGGTLSLVALVQQALGRRPAWLLGSGMVGLALFSATR